MMTQYVTGTVPDMDSETEKTGVINCSKKVSVRYENPVLRWYEWLLYQVTCKRKRAIADFFSNGFGLVVYFLYTLNMRYYRLISC